MGNTRKMSGGEEIANAKELFDKGVSNGKPDFRYVALAIGATPASPPRWAMLECLLEYEQTLRLTSSRVTTDRPENDPHKMMDAIALAYLKEHVRQESINRTRRTKPHLREMIRKGYEALALKPWPYGSDGDSYKQWERKWEGEQKNARIEGGYEYELFDLYMTPRIEEIITAFTGREMNLPEKPDRAAFAVQQMFAPEIESDN